MAFPQEHKRGLRPRIPIGFRALVHGWMEKPALQTLGKNYYRWVATQVAKSFVRFSDVEAVYVIGGGLSRCLPGVSDLDFVVVTDPVHEIEFLDRFQKIFTGLRKIHPMLGEVHLVKKDAWQRFEESSCASLKWFHQRHKYDKGYWKSERLRLTRNTGQENRLALSLFHFWKAQKFLHASFQGHKDYFRAHFVREISKASDYLQGGDLNLRRGEDWESLLLSALVRIEECSVSLIQTQKGDPAFKFQIRPNGPKRFAIEVQQKQWVEALRSSKVKGVELKSTTIPGVMAIDINSLQESSKGSLRSIFSQLQSLTNPPTVLGVSTAELVRRGLGWGAPWEHLDWLSPWDIEDNDFMSSVSFCSREAMSERLLLNATLFRGKLLSVSVTSIQNYFNEIYYCYYTLRTGTFSNEFESIQKDMKLRFPNLPSATVRDYVEALKEIENFLIDP